MRGTELRQFTEAGIPMLDELAKRFTKLEGRAVSVGEVFSRISKRMVSFRDVVAVFEDMTNKGGTFYQMQEEQSKTLYGMISNLKDSIDLMLNDIGRANDGILKSSISLVREFVENWRLVSVVLQEVAIAMAFMQVAKFIAGWQSVALLGTRLEKTLTGVALSAAKLRKALQALQLLIVSNPWIAAAAAVAVAAPVEAAAAAMRSRDPECNESDPPGHHHRNHKGVLGGFGNPAGFAESQYPAAAVGAP